MIAGVECKTKKCIRCNKILQIGKFYKSGQSKDGLATYCIRCESDRKKEARDGNTDLIEKHKNNNRLWYQNNKEKNKERNKKWIEENPARYRELNLKHRFGISLEDYNRILEEQNYCCGICGVHRDFITQHMAVDHCHKTGKIRGLLCKNCNSGLGFFQDNNEVLEKAITYLNQ